MLDIFNVEADVEVQVEKDSVGGFQVWATDLYGATLKAAFLGEFASGSKYIEVVLEARNEAGEILKHSERETVWSAKTKGAFYIDKQTNKKKQLIGLSKMDALGELLTGKKLKDSLFEEKVHTVYNKDAGGDIATPLPTLTEWCGREIYVGLQEVKANKQVKSGTKYVDTNEERKSNEVAKYFNENKQSNLEVKNNAKAEFFQDWLDANQGKMRDKFKPVAGGASAPVAGGVPSATAAPLQFNT